MKKIFIYVFLLIASAGFSQALSSDEIIQKYISAIGGTDELKKMKQITMYGKAESGGNIYEITAYEDRVENYQFAVVSGTGYEVRTYFDLKGGWLMQNGVKQDIDQATYQKVKMTVEDGTYFYLADMESSGVKTELLGEENIDGMETYKVKLTRNGENKSIQYFDKKTFYLIRLLSTATGPEIIVNYSDYKSVPGTGLVLPYKMTKGGINSVIDKYEINVPLDPSRLILDK